MEATEQIQSKAGFTPFETNTTEESDKDSNFIKSPSIPTPLGSFIVFAEQAKDPRFSFNYDEEGIYIDENGKVVKKSAQELAGKGLYRVWTMSDNPLVDPEPVIGKLQANIWLPETEFERSSDLDHPEEYHKEDEHIIALFFEKY